MKSMLVVGLHREDELVGLLTMGWHEESRRHPVRRGMVARRHDHRPRPRERPTPRGDRPARRPRTRVDHPVARPRRPDPPARFGRVTSRSWPIDPPASSTRALGGIGTAYGLLAPDGTGYPSGAWSTSTRWSSNGSRPTSPTSATGIRRWRAGDGPIMETFDPGVVPMPIIELARGAGLSGFAGFPIRDRHRAGRGGPDLLRPAPRRPAPGPEPARPRLDGALGRASRRSASASSSMASHHRFRTLFESSPDALFIERLDGTVLEVNDAAERMFRAERARLIGLGPTDLAVEEPSWPRLLTAVQRPGCQLPRSGDRDPQRRRPLSHRRSTSAASSSTVRPGSWSASAT